MIPLKVISTEAFLLNYRRLPKSIQMICDVQLDRLEENPVDPRLQRKKLKGQKGLYSIRVTRRYRALFFINQAQTIVVFAIDHRKDVYR